MVKASIKKENCMSLGHSIASEKECEAKYDTKQEFVRKYTLLP